MSDVFTKDPGAVLDYLWDWAARTNGGMLEDWLGAGETIQAATVTVPAGITQDSQSNTATTVTVWLSGGKAGQDYRVACRIVTSAGRTDERSITIRCRER